MEILIDTREQTPLEFHHEYITGVNRMKLEVGDYGVKFFDGYTPPLFFERKSKNDLFISLGKDYKRFKRELLRAQENNMQLILIIECSITDILKGSKYSMIEGITIIKKLFTLWVRHNLAFICCRNRDEMSIYIAEFYSAIGREYILGKKNKTDEVSNKDK